MSYTKRKKNPILSWINYFRIQIIRLKWKTHQTRLNEERERERERDDLLEKLKGESRPEVSVAAQPKALLGCSTSADFAIDFSLESSYEEKIGTL